MAKIQNCFECSPAEQNGAELREVNLFSHARAASISRPRLGYKIVQTNDSRLLVSKSACIECNACMEDVIGTLTIRNVDEELKARLRIEAAQHGHSMEEEVREILRRPLSQRPSRGGLGSRVHQRFATLADPGLELPPRGEPPRSADLPE